MNNLESILKSRDITLPTKVRLVKAMVFPVVIYGCESWTMKKAEQRRIDAFELWCWRRLLRLPWTARRSNQSLLIFHEYSLEGLMLKLKLQYFGQLMWIPWWKRTGSFHWKRPWCWERLKGGEEGDDRGWDGWMASPTQWRWVWVDSRSWWWTGRPGVLQSMGCKELDKTEQLNWTELIVKAMVFPVFMYRCESWTQKKAERGRLDAFELWCWRRLWRVPWTARRSNQSIRKGVSPEYSLEGLILKLKLQYSDHLMWRADSLEKTLILGQIENGRWRGWQRMRWLDGIPHSMDLNFE